MPFPFLLCDADGLEHVSDAASNLSWQGNRRGTDVSASLQGAPLVDGNSAETREADHVHVTSSRSHGRKLLLEAVDLDAPKSAKGRKSEERGRSEPEGVRIYPGDDAAEEKRPGKSKDGGSGEASQEGKREDKTAKKENKVRQGGDADQHKGAYYAQDVPLSDVPKDVAMKKPTLKASGDAASASSSPPSSKQSGKACPDVSSCQMVCAGMEHRHSMCTTSRGRGSYQAACCEGSGRVCPSPPCAGGPPSSDSSSSSAMPPLPLSSMFGGNHPGMPMPLRPQLITPHSFLGGDAGGGGGHHQHHSHRHMHDDGGPSSSSQHPLAPLLGHIGKMLNGGSGGIMPHIVHMGPGGSIFGSSENDGDCSRITPISSKSVMNGPPTPHFLLFLQGWTHTRVFECTAQPLCPPVLLSRSSLSLSPLSVSFCHLPLSHKRTSTRSPLRDSQ